jgi:hypothetical protein
MGGIETAIMNNPTDWIVVNITMLKKASILRIASIIITIPAAMSSLAAYLLALYQNSGQERVFFVRNP